MRNYRMKTFLALAAGLLLTAAAPLSLQAAPTGVTGWEIDSEYNENYVPREVDEFKAEIKEIKKIVPLDGMAPGVGVVVPDPDFGGEILVHVGPEEGEALWMDYRNEVAKKVKIGSADDFRQHDIQVGDEVKIRGVWAEIGGQDVFIASRLRIKRDCQLKVRLSKDGTPYWSMTEEKVQSELAAEKADLK